MLYNVIIIKNNIEEKRKHTYEKMNKENKSNAHLKSERVIRFKKEKRKPKT